MIEITRALFRISAKVKAIYQVQRQRFCYSTHLETRIYSVKSLIPFELLGLEIVRSARENDRNTAKPMLHALPHLPMGRLF